MANQPRTSFDYQYCETCETDTMMKVRDYIKGDGEVYLTMVDCPGGAGQPAHSVSP